MPVRPSQVGPTLDLSEKQIEKMHAAAEAFNEVGGGVWVGWVGRGMAVGCKREGTCGVEGLGASDSRI